MCVIWWDCLPRSGGFDFIVVGAGSAQPDKTVLLIEAGGDDRSVLIRVPGMVERVIESRRFDWHHAGQRGVPGVAGCCGGGGCAGGGGLQ